MRLKTTTHGILILALALVLTAPAMAQPGSLDAIGQMGGMPNLGAIVKDALGGRIPEGVTVEKLDNGLIKVAVPLREDRPVLRQKAKDLINCAITVEISQPTFAAQLLTFDAAPLDFISYYLGWVTINNSNRDITATTSLKTKGPGADFNTGNYDQVYNANAFNVLIGQMEDGFAGGIHNIAVKVKGAKPGKIQGNFCVDCV